MDHTPADGVDAPSPAQRARALPVVIQGGMGVAVSSWRLAGQVARAGGVGVVSGTALDLVLARRLQDGDADVRRALEAFPFPQVTARLVARYARPPGERAGRPYTPVPRPSVRPSLAAQELTVAGNFVEVWLAKQGHSGPVGVNYLEKIQMATPLAAYGAMLAGVDVVLVGAGIPGDVPALLDALAAHRPVDAHIHVDGADEPALLHFDPAVLGASGRPALRRPVLLAIVSAHVLAAYLARDAATCPDGYVIEGASAGGHNAPPRGRMTLDEQGEPVYGPRDEVDLAKVAALGLPFWLAGAFGSPQRVRAALAAGAAGVQVGTVFALSTDSGLVPALRDGLLTQLAERTLTVRTDPAASPTGFPFKVAELTGTLATTDVYAARPRLCDLGYLRVPFAHEDGSLGYRCPAEPVHTYLRKGGEEADTVARQCLCNALTANVGLGQTRADGYTEAPLVTLGSDLDGARAMLQRCPHGWTAAEAVAWLRDG